LNKIISWKPEANSGFITIKCNGENAFDVDNIKKITYYSEEGISNTDALVSIKYFPYFGQKNYRMPFIWAKIDVEPNLLVNIECKAYAENIDHERATRRGQTKFALYIQKKDEKSDI